MEVSNLPTQLLFRRADARPLCRASVRALVQSVGEVGIINPLRVRPAQKFINGVLADAFEIVAGAHRHEAASEIGIDTLPCVVVSDDDLHAELVMIDENLMRAELSASERAHQTSRRKEIYLELHPETAEHVAGGKGNGTADNLSTVPSFAASTADATGKDPRTVRRDAERGEKITTAALAMVKGTDLDTGVFLDKLKKVKSENQVEYVDKALREAKAPKRKPVPPADTPLNDFEAEQKWRAELFRVWNRGSAEWRGNVRDDLFPDTPVMDRRFG